MNDLILSTGGLSDHAITRPNKSVPQKLLACAELKGFCHQRTLHTIIGSTFRCSYTNVQGRLLLTLTYDSKNLSSLAKP